MQRYLWLERGLRTVTCGWGENSARVCGLQGTLTVLISSSKQLLGANSPTGLVSAPFPQAIPHFGCSSSLYSVTSKHLLLYSKHHHWDAVRLSGDDTGAAKQYWGCWRIMCCPHNPPALGDVSDCRLDCAGGITWAWSHHIEGTSQRLNFCLIRCTSVHNRK